MGGLDAFLRENDIKLVFLLGLLTRLLVYWLIPLDWNSDSYHHWLISYMTLHIGFSQGRMWDLLGCDYYWGIIPHLVQAFLLWLFRSNSIEYIRLLNVLLGSLNAVLVFKIAVTYYGWRNAWYSGISFAVFPVSVIFDSVGMQDTLALCFVLSSLYFMRTRFFWSGLLLGLACHTRVEYTMVSLMILVVFVLRERLFTDSQPYLLGWLVGWGLPTIHIWVQTGNPLYPLYWSLYSVFGGYTSKFKGLPFLDVFCGWLGARLFIWTQSIFGLLIIACGVAGVSLISVMVVRKWIRYQPLLYWCSSLMAMGPLFLPYFDSEKRYLLMMLRFMIPIVALGLPPFFHLMKRYGSKRLPRIMFVGVLRVCLVGYGVLVPGYSELQGSIQTEFRVVDNAASFYVGGTIVCDIPSMVYRFVDVYGVEAEDLLSNLYNPSYYGITEPIEYLRWLEDNNVQLWLFYGDRGNPVWRIVSENYPDVFVRIEGAPRAGYYLVDHGLIDDVL